MSNKKQQRVLSLKYSKSKKSSNQEESEEETENEAQDDKNGDEDDDDSKSGPKWIYIFCREGDVTWETNIGTLLLLFLETYMSFDYRRYGIAVENGG
jgi:hypothetical protein